MKEIRLRTTDKFSTILSGIKEFWKNKLNVDSINFSISDLIQLKNILSSVNSVITKATEIAFVRRLHQLGIITETVAQDVISEIKLKSSGANGYDVEINTPVGIAAEIKCNIPVNSDRFGAAQRNAIVKDIKGLSNPELKSKYHNTLSNPFLKFMVLLQTNEAELFNDAVKSIQATAGVSTRILSEEDISHLRTDVVYIMIINQEMLDISD